MTGFNTFLFQNSLPESKTKEMLEKTIKMIRAAEITFKASLTVVLINFLGIIKARIMITILRMIKGIPIIAPIIVSDRKTPNIKRGIAPMIQLNFIFLSNNFIYKNVFKLSRFNNEKRGVIFEESTNSPNIEQYC